MKTQLAKKLFVIISNLAVIGTLALAGVFSPAPAYADEATPTPRFGGERLALMCRQLGRMLEGQQDRLNFAGQVATQAETWINEQKAKGKDVTALETALAAYKAGLASAQAKLDAAQQLFDAQLGFDGNCQMTDREQAQSTLRSVGDALREAHRLLADAGRAFHRAVQEWRKANRPPQATATP